MSGLLAMIVGVLMIVGGPVFADAGNGSDKKDESLPAVATAASEGNGNSGDNGNAGGNSDKKDEAPAAAVEAPGKSGDNGNGAENGKGNDKKDEAAPAESNAGGNGNGSDNAPAGGSASEDKGKGAGWETSPGQEGKGCDQAGQGSGPYASTCDGSPSENGNGNGGGGGKPCAGCVGNADNKNPPGQMPNGSDPNNGYECDGNKGIGKGNPAHTSCTPGTPPPPPECKGKKCTPDNTCPGNSCNPCPGNGKKCTDDKDPCPGNSCNPCPGKSCEPHGPCDADPTMPGKQPCDEGEEPEEPVKPCDKDPNMPGTQPCKDDPDVVKPDVIDRPGQPGKPNQPVVLGERITRPSTPPVVAARQATTSAPGNSLPFTGANLLVFLGAGLSLTGAGVMLNGSKRK